MMRIGSLDIADGENLGAVYFTTEGQALDLGALDATRVYQVYAYTGTEHSGDGAGWLMPRPADYPDRVVVTLNLTAYVLKLRAPDGNSTLWAGGKRHAQNVRKVGNSIDPSILGRVVVWWSNGTYWIVIGRSR